MCSQQIDELIAGLSGESRAVFHDQLFRLSPQEQVPLLKRGYQVRTCCDDVTVLDGLASAFVLVASTNCSCCSSSSIYAIASPAFTKTTRSERATVWSRTDPDRVPDEWKDLARQPAREIAKAINLQRLAELVEWWYHGRGQNG